MSVLVLGFSNIGQRRVIPAAISVWGENQVDLASQRDRLFSLVSRHASVGSARHSVLNFPNVRPSAYSLCAESRSILRNLPLLPIRLAASSNLPAESLIDIARSMGKL